MATQRTFHWIPEDQLQPTTGDARIYRDYWWVTNAEGELGFYGPADGPLSPQCNQHEHTARKVSDYLEIPGAAGIKQVDLVAVPNEGWQRND